MVLLITYCLVAIVLSTFCSILESVFLSTTPSFVESYAKKHPRVGGYLKHLKENIEDAEGAILVLNTFAVTAMSTGFGVQVNELYGDEWQFVASALFAIAMIYITEILPKTIGAVYWQALAPSVAVCIHYLLKLTFPLVWVAKIIIHLLSVNSQDKISREEILAASDLGKKGGNINEKELRIIQNLLMLKKYQASDILTPRAVVKAYRYNDKIEDILKKEDLSNFKRVPVYAENTETVVGVVYTNDLLEQAIKDPSKELIHFIHPVYVVPDNISVLTLLQLAMVRKERFFVVQDRYGQFFGVLSFEDLTETLLGEEIVDEFDEAEDMQKFARDKIKNTKQRYEHRIKKSL
ncbi:CNNM domain-containing protein [Campylobacter troglodytis]|uniref:CNNM domain-containing protein n=1 Tax=Campylobacter troglodytis TaxID=654363 RepID=UPI001157173B|nr:CNNM domain-containing protein [Campylobacter troglodytis]TQR53172.1 transporter [Campylobacter troglodytis]